jgi:hypothetical protein
VRDHGIRAEREEAIEYIRSNDVLLREDRRWVLTSKPIVGAVAVQIHIKEPATARAFLEPREISPIDVSHRTAWFNAIRISSVPARMDRMDYRARRDNPCFHAFLYCVDEDPAAVDRVCREVEAKINEIVMMFTTLADLMRTFFRRQAFLEYCKSREAELLLRVVEAERHGER